MWYCCFSHDSAQSHIKKRFLQFASTSLPSFHCVLHGRLEEEEEVLHGSHVLSNHNFSRADHEMTMFMVFMSISIRSNNKIICHHLFCGAKIILISSTESIALPRKNLVQKRKGENKCGWKKRTNVGANKMEVWIRRSSISNADLCEM